MAIVFRRYSLRVLLSLVGFAAIASGIIAYLNRASIERRRAIDHLRDSCVASVGTLDNGKLSISFSSRKISDSDLTHLLLVGPIEELSLLDQSQLTANGLQLLGRLQGLEVLNLAKTHISDATIPSLSALGELRSLSLAGTKISERCLAALSELPSLESLDLSSTSIKDLRLTQGFTALTQISGTQCASLAIVELVGLPSLRTIDIDVSSAALEQLTLQDLPSLTSCRIAGTFNNHTFACRLRLTNLAALTQMTIDGVVINDKAMDELSSVAALNDLVIEGPNQVSDTGMFNLKRMTELTSLRIGRALITDDVFEPISQCAHLKRVALHECNIRGETIGKLQSCSELESLSLIGNDLAPVAIEQILALTTLVEIDLRSTGLSAEQIRPLCQMPQLQKLYVNEEHIGPLRGYCKNASVVFR